MSVKLKKVDRGIKKRIAALNSIRGQGVSVGIHAQEGAAQHREQPKEARPRARPLTVVEVGALNEFGLGVPERSFIRAWFDVARKDNVAALSAAVKLVAQGKKTVEEALDLFGMKAVGAIQRRISQGILPPNEPVTVRQKGSSKPLIDTGQLRQSITHLLRGRGR